VRHIEGSSCLSTPPKEDIGPDEAAYPGSVRALRIARRIPYQDGTGQGDGVVLGQVVYHARPRLAAPAAGLGVVHAYPIIGDDTAEMGIDLLYVTLCLALRKIPQGHPGLVGDHEDWLPVQGEQSVPDTAEDRDVPCGIPGDLVVLERHQCPTEIKKIGVIPQTCALHRLTHSYQ
jgi:hypothetical protein